MYSLKNAAVYLFLLKFGAALAAAPACAQTPTALAEEPAGVLTLARASAAALARSPALEGFSWELRASEARVLQAGLRPNPNLDAEIEDVAGTGPFSGTDQAQTTLLLSQMFELGGKRAARRDAAAAGRDLTEREYEIKRVDVLADVAEKFITLLVMQNEVALTRETTVLAKAALATARRRVRAGTASAIEEKNALVAVSRHRINEEHADHELAVARARMAATWASTSPAFERAEGPLFHVVPVATFEELATRLAAAPEQVRWAAQQQLRAAEARLAHIRRIPNVTLGAGVRRYEGSDDSAFVFGLTLPLPLADRNQGRRAETKAREQISAADGRAAGIRLHTALFAFYQELVHAATTLGSLESEIVPLASSALDLAEQGFRGGRLSYLELLDAQRTFVDVRRERIEVAATYQRLLLGIERLLGTPVHSTSMTAAQDSSEAITSHQQLVLGMQQRLRQSTDNAGTALGSEKGNSQ